MKRNEWQLALEDEGLRGDLKKSLCVSVCEYDKGTMKYKCGSLLLCFEVPNEFKAF